jgi:hypothetical protein
MLLPGGGGGGKGGGGLYIVSTISFHVYAYIWIMFISTTGNWMKERSGWFSDFF